ncbi:MAG: hypothetical protein ABR956_00895 [Terracidiphilus sp.]
MSDNAAAAIAYLTIVPAIVFLVLPPYNASPYVRFHAWQSVFLNVAACLIWFLLTILAAVSLLVAPALISVFHTLVFLGLVLVWILCVVPAVNGKIFKLPVIGALAAKQAGL